MFVDINSIFLFFSFLAEVIGTVGGFGSSVFFVPLANFYFDFETVLGLTALFHLSSNVSKIALFRKGLNKNLIYNIGIPSVIFVIIGGLLTKFIVSAHLELALGIMLISLSLLFLINKNLVVKPERTQSIIGGSISGFTAGLLGTGGAIRGITMAAFNLEKSVFVATSAAIDFGIDFTRTFVYFSNGYIGKQEILYVPFLFTIGLVGTYVGRHILKSIPQSKFKILSLALILLIGIITLFNTLYKA